MDERKTYTPPTAEIILLAPEEKLAAWDWSFENVWKNGYVGPDAEQGTASAVGIINGNGVLNETWTDDGFVIKR